MPRFDCLLLLILATTTAHAAEPTFEEILERVEHREPRTEAILTVHTTAQQRDKGTPQRYSQFAIRIQDKTAEVEMWNNYLTGKEGVSYTFPVSPKIAVEHERLQHLDRLRKLDAAVADAERRRRIFLLSSFQLEEGSKQEQVEAVFGKPESVTPWMKAGWETLEFSEVHVVLGFGKVHDIRPRSSE